MLLDFSAEPNNDEFQGLNRVLEDAHAKLDELETALKSDELGSDLRAVKDLIQKHSVLEQEMGLYEKRVCSFCDDSTLPTVLSDWIYSYYSSLQEHISKGRISGDSGPEFWR